MWAQRRIKRRLQTTRGLGVLRARRGRNEPPASLPFPTTRSRPCPPPRASSAPLSSPSRAPLRLSSPCAQRRRSRRRTGGVGHDERLLAKAAEQEPDRPDPPDAAAPPAPPAARSGPRTRRACASSGGARERTSPGPGAGPLRASQP